MIFSFMEGIFNGSDLDPDISIGENDGNGGGGSGGSGSGGSGGSSDNDEPGENETPGGSGGSSGPVDPDIPDDPETPDEPDVPDDPVQPGEPEDPDEPVNPDPEPDPETPIDPTPDEPDEPDEPVDPDIPNEPDEPEDPDEPVNPDPDPDPDPEPDPEVHEHTFGAWNVVEAATCTIDGLKQRECIDVDCDYVETEIISAAHKFNSSYVCTVCGFVDEDHHHVWGLWIIDVDSTCSTVGSKHRECECGAVDYATIERKDHTIASWYIDPAPTCESAGVKKGACSVCGHTEETPVNALGHFYDTDDVCDRCEEVRPHEHVWGEYEIINQSTCTAEGLQRATCTSCPEVNEVVIPKVAHVYGEWETTKSATCTEAGSRRRECQNCNDEQIQNVNALGHTYGTDDVCDLCGHISAEHVCVWGEYTIVTPATCTSEGAKSAKCTSCTKTNEVSIPKTAHEYGEWEITQAATCTTIGTQSRMCKNCSDTQTQTINALGHDWSEWQEVAAPGCTTKGFNMRSCNRCHAPDYVDTDPVGHVYDSNKVCVVCGDVTDHICNTSDWLLYTEPTCTEPGYRHKYCTICGKVKETEDIKPKGHTFVDHVCIICGECEHLVEEWFIETLPTCYTSGVEYGFCVRCSERIERYLEHVDHEYGSDNFCKYCRQPFPDSEDNSKSYEETDDTGTYIRNDIDVGYIYNGNMVIIGGCSVSNSGSNFPIEIMLTKPNIIKVRITVLFTHPVSENSVIIKSDSGEEFTPSLELSDDYKAVFEFEVDSSLVPIYHLTLYDLTGDGALARVTGLVIDLYT